MSWWLSLWAAPAALGFAIFFNVRRRTLVPIALLAIAAHLLRSLLTELDWGLVAASFAAALLVGTVAYFLGPATGEASPVYAFAPVIPLVPGTLLFEGLREIGDAVAQQTAPDLVVAAFTDLLTGAGVVLALVLGAIGPVLLTPGSARDVDRSV
jgi:uncharacterized membrane protein YjjB (DUF3815 family)